MSDDNNDKTLPPPTDIPEAQPEDILPAPTEPQIPPPHSLSADVSLDEALSREVKKAPGVQLRDKEAQLIKYGVGGAVVLILIGMVYSCQPVKGSMAYGICSTYLQMNTPYPYTLRYTGLEESNTAVRIYFTSIDPFGAYKQETLECKFGLGPNGAARVTSILRNRDPIDPALVKEFNTALPTIVASDPYLVMPPNRMNLPIGEYWRLHDNDKEIFRPMGQP